MPGLENSFLDVFGAPVLVTGDTEKQVSTRLRLMRTDWWFEVMLYAVKQTRLRGGACPSLFLMVGGEMAKCILAGSRRWVTGQIGRQRQLADLLLLS